MYLLGAATSYTILPPRTYQLVVTLIAVNNVSECKYESYVVHFKHKIRFTSVRHEVKESLVHELT